MDVDGWLRAAHDLLQQTGSQLPYTAGEAAGRLEYTLNRLNTLQGHLTHNQALLRQPGTTFEQLGSARQVQNAVHGELGRIQGELAELGQNLQALGADSQMQNLDMQNALQKMQQAVQIMSNMAKAMHDSSMAIIRNMGGGGGASGGVSDDTQPGVSLGAAGMLAHAADEVSLRPQPEPPGMSDDISLRPQPEPPGMSDDVSLRPQPEPPGMSDDVSLRPQPEPPGMGDSVSLRPQPEPPGMPPGAFTMETRSGGDGGPPPRRGGGFVPIMGGVLLVAVLLVGAWQLLGNPAAPEGTPEPATTEPAEQLAVDVVTETPVSTSPAASTQARTPLPSELGTPAGGIPVISTVAGTPVTTVQPPTTAPNATQTPAVAQPAQATQSPLTATQPNPTPTSGCAMVAPNLAQPPNNGTVSEDRPSLSWTYNGDCQPEGYRIDIARDAQMLNNVESGGTGNPSTVWAPAGALEDCQTYYWRVAGVIETTLGPYSTVWSFDTDFDGTCNGVQIVVPPIITIDKEPPSVSVTYSPQAPRTSDVIVMTANASDNVGVARIEIYFTPEGGQDTGPVQTCLNTTQCVYNGGPYKDGTYVLMARAYDAAGNSGSTWPTSVYVQPVVR